eukprot:6182398-Pyramimonas_sp.AAC.1
MFPDPRPFPPEHRSSRKAFRNGEKSCSRKAIKNMNRTSSKAPRKPQKTPPRRGIMFPDHLSGT